MIVEYKDPPISYDKVMNRRKTSPVHYHYQHELYLLISGETKYFVGDDIFHLRPGDFIFVPKEIIHKTDSEGCLRNERILLSFEDEIVSDEVRPMLNELAECKLIHVPANKFYLAEDLVRKIQLEYEKGGEYRDVLMKLYTLELITLLCRLKCDYTPQESESEKLINAVTEYIRTHYCHELSLAKLSKQFALSESHLSRKFKAVTGMGISEYITNVRIHNAARMLSKGECSVTKVAERCGYSDSNYFASVFKKVKGVTPLKFSKSQK